MELLGAGVAGCLLGLVVNGVLVWELVVFLRDPDMVALGSGAVAAVVGTERGNNKASHSFQIGRSIILGLNRKADSANLWLRSSK